MSTKRYDGVIAHYNNDWEDTITFESEEGADKITMNASSLEDMMFHKRHEQMKNHWVIYVNFNVSNAILHTPKNSTKFYCQPGVLILKYFKAVGYIKAKEEAEGLVGYCKYYPI